MVIDSCRFSHAQPSAGTRKMYIDMIGTSGTGMISNCRFGGAATTQATVANLKGTVLMSDAFGSPAAITS